MKSKILSVIKYTVEKNIRNKWFIILNLLLCIVTVGILNFENIKSIFKNNGGADGNNLEQTELNIYVLDTTGFLFEQLQNSMAEYETYKKVTLNKVEKMPEYTKDTIDKKTVLIETILVSENIIETNIISKEGIDTKYYDVIKDALRNTKYKVIERDYNISEELLLKISEDPVIHRTMLGVNDENSYERQGIQTIVNYAIFFVLLMVLSKISNDISQEKLSKSIEYVLTSISAKGYLIAKVVSMNITILIQVMFEVVYYMIGSAINSIFVLNTMEQSIGQITNSSISGLNNIFSTNTIIYITILLVYMILTVLIQSVIQAAFSAKTTNISEAGNSTTVLIILNMVIYFISIFVITPLKEPNIFMYILSCIPIISTYFIPTMIVAGHATILQVVIATILLIAAVPLAFNLSEKSFKNGILSYSVSKNKAKKNEKENLTVEDIQKQIIVKNNYKKVGFVIGFSILLFITLQIFATFAFTPVVNLFKEKLTASEISSILNIIVYVISFILPILFVYAYTRKDERIKKNKEANSIKSILITIPIIILIQFGVGIILEKIGMDYDILEKFNMFDNSTTLSKILFFIQTAILPAIFEELYIRGAVLNFTKKYGIKFAVLFSAIMFAVIHMNVSQILFAFLMGIVLATITFKTGSILPACIVHFLNNGYAALIMIFENNAVVLAIINVVYMLLAILGCYYLLKEAARFLKEKRKIGSIFEIRENINIKENMTSDTGYRYIFNDYTMVIAIILVISMIFVMQNMISIL